MKIYFAAVGRDDLLKKVGKNVLFSYYDLTAEKSPPFRKIVWRNYLNENHHGNMVIRTITGNIPDESGSE